MITRLLRLSIGGILQFIWSTASWVVMVWIVSGFGTEAVAGYTLAIRIIIFAIMPSWGLANAAATLVGQNLGAGSAQRAERSVWLAGRYNAGFLFAVGAIFIFLSEPLMQIFTSEAEVIAYGSACLFWVSLGYPFFGFGMVLVQAFNGAGDTQTPSALNFVCYWLIQIPLAYVLSQNTAMGVEGVFLSITISASALTLLGILLFRRGRWKTREV